MTNTRPILVAFGTRPEAIKLAPVIRALDERVTMKTCAIAQHRELLDAALASFGLRADIDLDLMTPDQDLTALTARVLGRMREVFDAVQPSMLVVQGDTTSAMAAALAGHQANIPVAHVEAGLRTSTVADPWPEEPNRRIITRIAQLHFAPTEHARENLLAENVSGDSIVVTGNPGIDAARMIDPVVPDFAKTGRFVLATCHRRENQQDDFAAAARVIERVATRLPERPVVLARHPSPRIEPLYARLRDVANVRLVAPMGYSEMLGALERAHAVLTDSGGVQEECAWFGTPCVVMRAETDRPESVERGLATVVGHDPELAVSAVRSAHRHSPNQTVFGDGYAADRIADALVQWTQT